jgi:hypothetical protein
MVAAGHGLAAAQEPYVPSARRRGLHCISVLSMRRWR